MFALLARLDRRFAFSRTAALLFAFSLVMGMYAHGHVHQAHASHHHGIHHGHSLNNVDAHGIGHNSAMAHDTADGLLHASEDHERQVALFDNDASTQELPTGDAATSIADHAHCIVFMPPALYAVQPPTAHDRGTPSLMPARWSRNPALLERPPKASA